MKNYFFFLFLTGLALYSCSSDVDRQYKQEISKNELDSLPHENQDLMLDTLVLHEFSDNNSLDTFSLSVRGTNSLDSNVNFKIRNRGVLYEKNFNAHALIPYGQLDDTSSSAIRKMIEKGFRSFFTDDNFFKPAISKGTYDNDTSVPDFKEWKAIKMDTTAIAFRFNELDEAITMIVYLKRDKKVVEFNP